MVRLSSYGVNNVLTELNKELPRPKQRQTKILMELFAEGKVTEQLLMSELFHGATESNASESLNQFILDLNDALIKSNSKVRITTDQKAGKDREIWFEEDDTPMPIATASEMERVKRANVLETGQKARLLNPPILLLTFNPNELTETLKVFNTSPEAIYSETDDSIFYDLGTLNQQRIYLRHSSQGNLDAYISAQSAIKALQPHSVIALGIAFGRSSEWQNIGDVLISHTILPYEHGRVDQQGFTPRQGMPTASHFWVERFKQLQAHQKVNKQAGNAKMWIDPILSGDKLVDDDAFKHQLAQLHKEYVGGEMEGYGVYRAAHEKNIHWCVVKAICDWADGNKENPNRDKDQKLAARHAAQTLSDAINLRPFPTDMQPIQQILSSNSEAEEHEIQECSPDFQPHAEDMRVLKEKERLIIDAKGARTSLNKNQQDIVLSNVDSSNTASILDNLISWAKQPKGPQVFAILAEYGMGKTVSCQLFDEQWRESRLAAENNSTNKDPFPLSLYFDLRKIAGFYQPGITSTKQLINNCIEKSWHHDAKLTRSYNYDDLYSWASQYGLILIFDGLDEVLVRLTEIEGQQFTNSLFKLLRDLQFNQIKQAKEKYGLEAAADIKHPPLKMLLSCRTQYFRTLSEQQNHFTGQERGELAPKEIQAMVLLPFTEAQIKQYLTACLPGLEIDRVLDTLKTVHDLQDLSRRPFTLKMVAEFFPELEEDIAKGKAISGVSLYRRMANRWLERDSGKHHIKPDHKLRLAAHLAAWLWQQSSRTLQAEQIENWFNNWLENQDDINARYKHLHRDKLEEDLRTATFLAREDDENGNSRFRFAHTSLQEYFLACYLLQAMEKDEIALWQIPQPSEESLVFLAQLLAEPENASQRQTYAHWITACQEISSENLLALGLVSWQTGLKPLTMNYMNLQGANLGQVFIGIKKQQQQNALANEPFTKPLIDMQYACFDNAVLSNTEFNGVNLTGASFNKADLYQTIFHQCHINQTQFIAAQTSGSIFHHCVFEVSYSPESTPDAPTPLSVAAALNQAQNHHTSVINQDKNTCITLPNEQTIHSTNSAVQNAQNSAYPAPISNGHQQNVTACAITPDGKTVVSASFDRTVRVWDTQSGKTLMVFYGHTDTVTSCAITPDARFIVSASDDNTVRLWSTQNHNQKNTHQHKVFEGHSGSVNACAVTPDARFIVSASNDNTVRLWSTQHHNQKNTHQHKVFEGHFSSVNACAVTPDARFIVSASRDRTVRLWSTQHHNQKNTHQHKVFEGHYGCVNACAVTPDARFIASASDDNNVRLWSTQDHNQKNTHQHKVFKGHYGCVNACAVTPNARFIVSASSDNTVRLWSTQHHNQKNTHQHKVFEGHSDLVNACAVTPDASFIVSASNDKTVRLWSTQHHNQKNTHQHKVFEGHSRWVNACAVTPDTRFIVSVSDDNTVRLWSTQYHNEPPPHQHKVFEGHSDLVKACAVTPDARFIVSASHDNTVRLWSTQHHNQKNTHQHKVFEGHSRWVNACAVTPDARFIVSASDDKTVRLWSTQHHNQKNTHQHKVFEGHSGWVNACAVTPDARFIVSASSDNTVRLWNTQHHNQKDPHQHKVFEGHSGWVNSCAVTPDARFIVSASNDNTVRLWSTQRHNQKNAHQHRVFEGHTHAVIACGFTRDGKAIYSSSDDKTLRIWDIETTEELQRYFSLPDGGYVCWSKKEGRTLHASPNAWRYMSYLLEDEEGNPIPVPVT